MTTMMSATKQRKRGNSASMLNTIMFFFVAALLGGNIQNVEGNIMIVHLLKPFIGIAYIHS